MTPETFAELKAAEIILMHLTRDFLSRQENPLELANKMKDQLLAQDGLDNPEMQKAALGFFDSAVGVGLRALGHDYKYGSAS